MAMTRRAFLAGAGAGATFITSRSLWAQLRAPRPAEFRPAIGITGGPEQAAQVKDLGAEYLEVSCAGWLVPDKSDEEFAPRRKQMLECGLPVRAANSFLPGTLRCTGPNADPAGVAAYAAVAFRRAQELGIEVITFGSSGSRTLPDGFSTADAELQFVALLSRIAPLAEKHGLQIGVEPLQRAETNFLHFVREARRLVDAVQHPCIGITADIFHMLRGEEDAGAIGEAGRLVRHVHIAEKRERTAPGVDGDDFSAYLQALKSVGYTGRISMECGWSDLAQQFPRALATLRKQIEGLA